MALGNNGREALRKIVKGDESGFWRFLFLLKNDTQKGESGKFWLPYGGHELQQLKMVLRAWVARLMQMSQMQDEWYKGF